MAAAICVLSAALMSILPAVHIFRADLGGVMGRQSGRASHPGVSRGLVAFQVGLATLLMTGGFALVRRFSRRKPGCRSLAPRRA